MSGGGREEEEEEEPEGKEVGAEVEEGAEVEVDGGISNAAPDTETQGITTLASSFTS